MFKGQSLLLTRLDNGIVEICFDRAGDPVNKFDKRTVHELKEAVAAISADSSVRGVLVTSAKATFIVGADITEFGALFQLSEEGIAADVAHSNEAFNAFEDLSVPTVVAINGYALGGGLEFALSATWRVVAEGAQLGLPEVKLGLFPGFGGTVRLPRVAGLATAADWIGTGRSRTAQQALADGVADRICSLANLREDALSLLRLACDGQLDWRHHHRVKLDPLPASADDPIRDATCRHADALDEKHQPAAIIALELMRQTVTLDRAGALHSENVKFAQVARTQAADSLVQNFLSEQAVKRSARQACQGARPVSQVAVLGAGIMGGGIAQNAARCGIAVRLKDPSEMALSEARAAAARQFSRQVRAGRLTAAEADAVLALIATQTDEAGFEQTDLVIEAIIERLEVKHAVLSALEKRVPPGTVIATNTSSLRIDEIAHSLERPQQFVGMHFFNPVPAMQLVEVIRGSHTSDAAAAAAVGFAMALGKTPIIVRDCPGFLVNRVLMAYLGAALRLIVEGVDFQRIDQVMEGFGWPMGPSQLQDVIGIDTGSHVADVIAAGYPDRMPEIKGNPLQHLLAHGRLGQKSGHGFYRYERDESGKLARHVAEDTYTILAEVQRESTVTVSDAHIVDRLMLALVVEAACALEDGIAASPAEIDLALQLGLGCPSYLGGALKYADWLGLAEVARRCDALRKHGPMYEPTVRMRHLAAQGGTFYQP